MSTRRNYFHGIALDFTADHMDNDECQKYCRQCCIEWISVTPTPCDLDHLEDTDVKQEKGIYQIICDFVSICTFF